MEQKTVEDTRTKEKAINYLRECGWLERHDKEIYEDGYEDGVATRGFTDGFKQEDMEKEYQRGYEDGRKSNEVTMTTDGITFPSQSILGVAAAAIADDKMGYKHGYDDGYQRGLDDMQNALLAIDKWNNDYKALVFHGSLGSIAILKDHKSKYIVDEVRRYQEEQTAKIAVGDEVTYHDDRGVVTMIANNGQTIMVLSAKGGWLLRVNRDEVKKTGRSFPEFEKLWDKLKEGKDEV